MKPLFLLFLTLFSLTLQAQQTPAPFDGHKWEAPYHLPVPANWGIERFLIPISFAPQIQYKGVEDIRFTPGWGKAASEEYWSYAFLWWIDGKIEMNAARIESNLTAYYTGLVAINGQSIPKEKIIPVVTSFKETATDKGDTKTFIGTIKILDYMTQQPILLNAKAHVKSCAGQDKTVVFYELSPQPFLHSVWKSLDQLWVDFNCSIENYFQRI